MGLDQPLILVLAGPTAVGKTETALQVAEALGTEIVGADSRQVYRQMDIGTAKPTSAELARVTHRMIDRVEPDQDYDAARFSREARHELDELIQEGHSPLLVGGTGLYIRVCLEGLCPAPGPDPDLRARLRDREESAPGSLHARLTRVDPEAAARIPPGDIQRTVRALEIQELDGRTATEIQRAHAFADRPYRPLRFYLHREREELNQRIQTRVGRMVEQGLLEEVRLLLKAGFHRELRSMTGLGYRQVAAHLAGEISLPEAVEATIMATRQYAKRQRTWFRNRPDYRHLDLGHLGCRGAAEAILQVRKEVG